MPEEQIEQTTAPDSAVAAPETVDSESFETESANLRDYHREKRVARENPSVVEPPKEETQAGTAENSENSETSEAQKSEAELEEQKRKRRSQRERKIDRLTAENARLLAELSAARPVQAEPQTPKQTSEQSGELKRPILKDFDDYDLYTQALEGYLEKKVASDYQKQVATKTAEEKRKTVAQGWESQLTRAREKFSDFDKAVKVQIPITQAMADSLLSSDLGAEVTYHLSKNPSEAERIAKLEHPLAVAREIGRIEARLSAQTEAPKPVTRVAPVPAPIRPVLGGSGPRQKTVEEMSNREYLIAKKNGAILR